MEHFVRWTLNERLLGFVGKLIPQMAAKLVLQIILMLCVAEPVFGPRIEEPICSTGLQQVVHSKVDTGNSLARYRLKLKLGSLLSEVSRRHLHIEGAMHSLHIHALADM